MSYPQPPPPLLRGPIFVFPLSLSNEAVCVGKHSRFLSPPPFKRGPSFSFPPPEFHAAVHLFRSPRPPHPRGTSRSLTARPSSVSLLLGLFPAGGRPPFHHGKLDSWGRPFFCKLFCIGGVFGTFSPSGRGGLSLSLLF